MFTKTEGSLSVIAICSFKHLLWLDPVLHTLGTFFVPVNLSSEPLITHTNMVGPSIV